MTGEQLAAIRESAEYLRLERPKSPQNDRIIWRLILQDVPALVNEVERLSK